MAGQLPRAVSGGAVSAFKDFGGPLGSFGMVRELVTGATTSSYKALSAKVPANSWIFGYAVRCTTAGTISTGTHIGLGTGSAGDPDAIFELTFTSYDAVNDNKVGIADAIATGASVFVESEQTLSLASLNGSGAAAGDITAGVWDITVYYITLAESVAV